MDDRSTVRLRTLNAPENTVMAEGGKTLIVRLWRGGSLERGLNVGTRSEVCVGERAVGLKIEHHGRGWGNACDAGTTGRL